MNMTHIFTKTSHADYIWIIGMRAALAHSGGGRMVKTRRGYEVWAVDHHSVIGTRYVPDRVYGITALVEGGGA